MIREIKFRAWDKKFNLMLYPDNFYNEYISADGKVIEIEEWSDYSGGGYKANDVSEDRILMQYTGLKDKNGKEIYEGDIILLADKLIRHVEYDRGAFVLVKTEDTHLYPLYTRLSPIRDYITDYRFEVIGNIYENPELLEQI